MISLQAQNFNRSINLNMICVNDTTFDPFDANTVCDGMTQTGKLVITKWFLCSLRVADVLGNPD